LIRSGFLSDCTFFTIRPEPSGGATVPIPTVVGSGGSESAKTPQAATENIALRGAYACACGRTSSRTRPSCCVVTTARGSGCVSIERATPPSGLVGGEVQHRHDDDAISQQEHQIVEPVLRWVQPVASTPHAVTIALVIVPAPTIMPPRNDVWPSDRVTDDCAACGPERP